MNEPAPLACPFISHRVFFCFFHSSVSIHSLVRCWGNKTEQQMALRTESVLNVFWQTYNLCTHFTENDCIHAHTHSQTKMQIQRNGIVKMVFTVYSIFSPQSPSSLHWFSVSIPEEKMCWPMHLLDKKVIRAKHTKPSLDEVFLVCHTIGTHFHCSLPLFSFSRWPENECVFWQFDASECNTE